MSRRCFYCGLKFHRTAPTITNLWPLSLSSLSGVWNDVPQRELLWTRGRTALWDPLSRLQGNPLCQLPETCHWYVGTSVYFWLSNNFVSQLWKGIDQSCEVIPGIEILGFEANVSISDSMSVYESMLEWKVSSWAYRTQQSCYTSLGNAVAMLLCYTVVYSTIL